MKSFVLLCQALSLAERSAAAESLESALRRPDSVTALVRLADGEMLAPALWEALRRKRLDSILPDRQRGALQRRYQMNTLLNERIRAEAEYVSGLCTQLDVTPITLKGGAFLFEAEPDRRGIRAMRDLDIMVPEQKLKAVAEALMDAGYRIKEGEDEDWTYAFPSLERPGGVVAIELHRFVGQQRSLLPAADAWKAARKLDGAEGRFLTLSPNHRIWHNIFHSQIQDRGHLLGLVWLRQLLDLVEIVRRYEREIDWDMLINLFDAQGMQAALLARFYQAHVLLGADWPLPISPGLQAKFHHGRSMALQRIPSAMWLTRFVAAATAPLKKYHIDLLYGCGTDRFIPLFASRVRHAWKVARKYRGAMTKRMWKVRKYDV